MKNKVYRPLKLKILYAVIAVSILMTLILSFINFYIEYKNDIKVLNVKLEQLKESTLPSISNALWNIDNTYLKVQLNSLIKMEDVIDIRVFDAKGNLIINNDKKQNIDIHADDKMFYRFPMYFFNSETSDDEFLGTMQITATTVYIKKKIYSRIAIFVLTQFLTTFLISLAIVIVFHLYITKSIERLVLFTKGMDVNAVHSDRLKIERDTSTRDEIDDLQDEINRMIDKIQIMNKEKNLKISEQEMKIELQKAATINNARLNSVNEMLAGVAHEINNPLTIINLSVKKINTMIAGQDISDERVDVLCKKAMIAIQRINLLINSVKTISSSSAVAKIEKFTVEEYINSIKFPLQVINNKNNIPFNFYFDTEKTKNLLISINSKSLYQVFYNLIKNAIEHQAQKENPWVEIRISSDQNTIYFSFVDSGNGIMADIQDKLFNPFFTTKDIGHGTGLGLAMSLAITKEHAGKLYFQPNSEYTTFVLEIPICLEN